MTLVALVPVLAAVIGVLVYALASNAKVAELGRLTFFAGLFVALLVFATKVVKL
jgi:hypothetical protein